MRIVVVGAGAAGIAAAWRASRAGAEVEVIHAKPGATELYSGALDLGEWDRLCTRRIDPEVAQFAEALQTLLADPARAARMGEAARAKVEGHHSLTHASAVIDEALHAAVHTGAALDREPA